MEKRMVEEQEMFEEIIGGNFLEYIKDVTPQIQETQ